MTVIYVPRLIESAEQAEALPWGTIARSDAFAPEVFVKDEDSWMGTHGPGAFTNESAVGLEALVPIEAEEETREHPTRVEERPESAYLQPVQQVRYKTRWESA